MRKKSVISDNILSQHIAILGKTGSGKTSTAKLIVEQVVSDDARVCILDPIKSDWWGLISSASGKKEGLPFQVLGGPYGHVPLHAGAGKAIAEIVANGSLPLSIIDMADFKPGGQSQFFVEFAPILLRKMKGVVYLVIEEAHLFAPKERSGIGQENMAIYWSKRLATAGRSKGIRLIFATHRTQDLHNALLDSCDTLIAHRMTAPSSQKPVIKWLKANTSKELTAEVSGSLASLKTGEAWLCSGEAQIFERRKFPRISTYDNTATPTGEGTDHQVKTAKIDAEKLAKIIGHAVDEAKANDPKLLKQEIAELKRKLLSHKPVVDESETQREMEKAVATRDRYWQGELQKVSTSRGSLLKKINKARSALELNGEASATFAISDPPRSIPTGDDLRPPRRPVHNRVSHSDQIAKGERVILIVAAQYNGGATREQISILTGYKRSTRDAYILRLKEKDLIVDSGTIIATEEGIAALGDDYELLPTGNDLREYWLNRLPEGEKRILEILMTSWPEEMDRSEIGEHTDYKRSTRDAYILRLKTRKLVSARKDGVKAADVFFE